MPGKLVVRREIAYISGTRHRRCLDSSQHGFARGRADTFRSLNAVATSARFLYSIVRARTRRHRFVHHRGVLGGVIRKMSGVGKRTYIREVNPYLICPLCRGYLIDATTVVECLHSFCRSCILKHLNTEAHCPSCKHVLNKAKPDIKADKALQDIVYKLVPGLYHKEMRKRREFYKKHPEHAHLATPEQRGEDVSGRLIFAPEDAVSLSLEYLPPGADPWIILRNTSDDTSNLNASNNQTSNGNNGSNTNNNNHGTTGITSNRRYLQCPALVTIAHLKKFLALKYSVDMTRYTIEICHRRGPLPEHWTLMDVAYMFAWKRNAPMRFFYRVTLEEQRLEAPPHDRPSTPGLGASLPPVDAAIVTQDNVKSGNAKNDAESKPELECTNNVVEKPALDNQNEIPSKKRQSTSDQVPAKETKEITIKEVPPANSNVATLTTSTSTTASITTTSTTLTTTSLNTVASSTTNSEPKQIETALKILKNPDGRYEVLRSPPGNWNLKEQSAANNSADASKSTNPEFSVVSIGSGQNSNGVKITLKQCTPNNTSPKKPKIISDLLLHCGQVDKDASGALVFQHLHRDSEKHQVDKQEKQRRRVTFMERSTPEKATINNVLKTIQKKPGEQQEKKQFLQGFQLTAKESGSEVTLESASKSNDPSANKETNSSQKKASIALKKEDSATTDNTNNKEDGKSKSNSENIGVNASASKRVATMSGISGNARVNANKQCSDVDTCTYSCAKTTGAAMNIAANNNPAKVDVYTFSNDPPVLPAGAVKRKCPPGLPIFDIKKKRTQQIHPAKKQAAPVATLPVVQNNAKSPRKLPMEHVVPTKRPANAVGEAGPSRTPTTPSSKPSSSPVLSNDTRNILDGCGLNIPASLSITLTAPKSPGNSGGYPEPSDSKDNRKNALGKVSPSITLNDRSVDPRVLKALKAGQIRMPAPPKPRQTKQPDVNQPHRQTPPGKRKRNQESRDILDLSGVKKVDIHPLRIPQPVTKLKAKSTPRDMPNIPDQGQVVTVVGGQRYYRAPPGSLTPAAHRVSDCPLPTPSRTPVYAPGLSSPLNSSRPSTNLSSVFPSLQSLYALSQAPNLQQFQMDARLRLPRGTDTNASSISNTDNRNMNANIPGKSHLAAQCAPAKPARSSVAPLAVAITKQQQSTEKPVACINRSTANEISKTPAFRNNESLDSTESGQQQSSVQSKYPPVTEANSRYSPRNGNGSGNVNNEDKTSVETPRDSASETSNDTRKEPENSSRQTPNREAASPRVSSTASPSPPPGDTNANRNDETTRSDDNVNTVSNGIDSNLPAPSPTKNNNIGAEVSSSKSPASPDSSSVTIETPSRKSCSTVEQGLSSPSQTADAPKSSENSTKADNNVVEDSTNDNDKKTSFKQADAKQLTSEMFEKRLLAAFPSNEWANNPIAAVHLGNFLKSLNASIKSENKMESVGSEKVENQLACNDATRLNNEASSKPRTDVSESS
ncbi:uncharacterized protein LOC143432582 isoform X1 [Xylocopa sonorina]|uniref:uncharacterized protein LOC143432582 isoform X1 n=2 Tax=Xylocopa sonorina TaxID=1818115 RepID=UPI00403AEE08